MAVAAALLVSCDPIKEEKDLTLYTISQTELDGVLTFEQQDADGNAAADGNYIHFKTNPSTWVSIYNTLADGSENLLAYGYDGYFTIKPKRGSDPNQKVIVRVVNTDGTTTLLEKTFNVYVQQELDPEIRFLASDEYSTKIWYWDPSITGAVWGNMGYCGGKGSDVGISGNGQWWGVGLDENGELSEFLNQLAHTPDGKAHGDESIKAYMSITDDGMISSVDKDNNVIRTGTYTVSNYDASNPDAWKVGDLVTKSILWPYEINSGGNIPGTYEIVYLTPDKLCLVYPDKGDYGGLGNWGEATFWHFTSMEDLAGMAVGYGKSATKSWTWDYDGTNTVWGNMGYCGGKGSDVGANHNGQWWGVINEEEFMGQLAHSGGVAHGDESMDAYFTLSNEGTITRYDGKGNKINSGTFEIARASTINPDVWKVGDLKTTAGTILFPYEINSGGKMPETFEIVYLTNNKMCLVYPDGGAFDSLGSWGEATYWHFKAK